MRTKIKDLNENLIGQTVTICGWTRSIRNQKSFSFLEINDGSCFSSVQVILDQGIPEYEKIKKEITTHTSVCITGEVKESPAKGQSIEIKAENITILGLCDAENYPLQKKRHSFEFLRSIAHLRPRTNTQGAVLRVRGALSFASHQFFQTKGFTQIFTPIITGSDCEGGGDLFQVTTLKKSQENYGEDFFGKKTFLTVSGQLNSESIACALGDVYTFGPTFRAENSHTSRHLAEFWMLEPEMAFYNLEDTKALAEEYLKYVVNYALENCKEDLAFFDKFIEKGLLERLSSLLTTPFAHLTYTQAIETLLSSNKKFEFPVSWGIDLQSEHERFLSEEHCKCPVFITDYPKEIKAFYMKMNEDRKTVKAMDLLVPKQGELMGGSQREESLEKLEERIKDLKLDLSDYQWYLDLRRFGSVPHSGFGLGFERLIQFVTGIENIRDTIPFPRYPNHAEF